MSLPFAAALAVLVRRQVLAPLLLMRNGAAWPTFFGLNVRTVTWMVTVKILVWVSLQLVLVSVRLVAAWLIHSLTRYYAR